MINLLLSLCLAAEPAPTPTPPEARAQAALAPFKKSLKEALLTAMAKSPEHAIDVCEKEAPALAAKHSGAGMALGRSAFKLRNPKNAPPAWLEAAMASLSKEKSGAEAFRVTKLPDGRVGYAEAIWIAPPCLVCHGVTIAPALEAKLSKAYPKDAARGFALGDFRGVFWAELDAK